MAKVVRGRDILEKAPLKRLQKADGWIWAQAVRGRYYPAHLRCIFDVESLPGFAKKSLKDKLKKANEINRSRKSSEAHVVTETEYKQWSKLLYEHPTVKEASDYFWAAQFQQDKFREHAEDLMEMASRERAEPDDILKAHRFIDTHQKNVDTRHNLDHKRKLKELNKWYELRAKAKSDEPIDVTPGQLKKLPGEE